MNLSFPSSHLPEPSQLLCPNCQTLLDVVPDYRTWCDRCGWNLQTSVEMVDLLSPFDKLYQKLSQRYSETLFKTLLHTPNLRRPFTVARLVTFSLATLVHALSVGFVVVGVGLLVLHGSNLFALFGSLVSFCLAWFARPRLGKLPERELERLRRLERLPSSRVDTTHPPTVYRLDFQTAHPQQGRVRLSPEDDERLRRELSRVHPKLQKRLVDAFRANLYH